jgi:hypothetical protein
VSLGFVRARSGEVQRLFPQEERRLLQDLCRGLLAVLGGDEDPVLARLLPEAYPDDAEASAEYAGYTRARLARAKAEPAEAILLDLGTSPAVVRLDPPRVELWLRGLTDLRLALYERAAAAARDGDADPGLEHLADWLGWLLSDLLETIED